MSKIRVKHFGPIRDGRLDHEGWIEIRKVTLFLGDQGVGKSTLAKVLSTMTWMEKSLVRGDETPESLQQPKKLASLLRYHRLQNYFKPGTELCYVGDAATIEYANGQVSVQLSPQDNYQLPQVMYVPAERNFISYIEQPDLLNLAAGNMKEFLAEFDRAKKALNQPMSLPFGQSSLSRDGNTGDLTVTGGGQSGGYRLGLSETASGYQSSVPLLLVTQYLVDACLHRAETRGDESFITHVRRLADELSPRHLARLVQQLPKLANESENENDLRQAHEQLSTALRMFDKNHLMNIVEEPEQNLYPESQWKLLESLLILNNQIKGNKLVMTSHSPYLINVLSLAVQTQRLLDRQPNEAVREQIQKIFDTRAATAGADVVVYQIYPDGKVEQLADSLGVPTDENFLNHALGKCNDAFNALSDIEDEL